jgi:hypothetical protein
MLLKTSFLTLALTLFSTHAFAEELTVITVEAADMASTAVGSDPGDQPVDTNHLRLIGRGVGVRSGESMALACIDEPCSQARMVFFEKDGKKAFYFGRTFQFAENGQIPTQSQVEASLKKFSDQYRRIKRNYSFGRTVAFVLVGAGTVVGLAILTGSGLIYLGALGLLVYLHGNNYYTNIHFSAKHPDVATFDSQNGWSWSSKPKRVSRKAFYNLSMVVRYSFH